MAAVAAGVDGLIVEVHYKPSEALSDGDQSLTPEQFSQTARKIRELRAFMNNMEKRKKDESDHKISKH